MILTKLFENSLLLLEMKTSQFSFQNQKLQCIHSLSAHANCVLLLIYPNANIGELNCSSFRFHTHNQTPKFRNYLYLHGCYARASQQRLIVTRWPKSIRRHTLVCWDFKQPRWRLQLRRGVFVLDHKP